MQVDFDPDTLSYAKLVKEIFSRLDPFHNISSTQYMHAIWYHNEEQLRTINNFLSRRHDTDHTGDAIQTRIEPAGTFYRAEDYHQKYTLQKYDQYMQLFEDLSIKELTDSTAAARLNGILANKAKHLDYPSLTSFNFPERLERDLHSRVS